MTLPKTRHRQMLLYAPKPIEAYTRTLGGKRYGPEYSKLLDSPEAWNLAFLSHDYDKEFQHSDPQFTTLVRRTLQTRLDGRGLGIGLDPTTLVGSLLNLPAPRFVYLLRCNPTLVGTLPLFAAYGESWLKTIELRERVCETGWKEDGMGTTTKIACEVAANLIAKLRKPA